MIDSVLMGCFCVALFFNKNIAPALVAYFMCIVYQNTLFDLHSEVINHVIYGMLFIPCIYFATIRLASAMLAYSAFHLVIAMDYFLFPFSDTIMSMTYDYIQVTLSFSLIYFSRKGWDNEPTNNSRFAKYNFSGLGSIWNISTH